MASRGGADYVHEPAPPQRRDTVGLVAAIVFAVAGITYLVGGHSALSGHPDLVLPVALVLLGLAGLAGSGLLRLPVRRSARKDEGEDSPVPESG